MRMGYDLILEQQQKLIMTPELRLALKILQLPTIELEELVKQELETNPVLDVIEDNQEEKAENPDKDRDEEKSTIEEIDWKEYFQYQGKSYCLENTGIDDSQEMNYDNLICYSDTLKDHLLFQLNTLKLGKCDRIIGEYIIESLDDNGYLCTTIDQISSVLSASKERVEKVLRIIQTFEPIGVGALNLMDCLLIQIHALGIADENLESIIKDHLDDIAGNRLQNIAKKLSITVAEVQEYSDIIKSLEPKPGRSFFCGTECRYVIPDVFVEKIENEYIITINDNYSSRLMVNQYYKSIINTEDKSSEALSFINDKLSSALWLIKSLEQRKNTLYRVVKAIVDYQRDFFEKGDSYLKTMTLRNIADEVQVHESTVSRAISGKYAQTPRGIFEIKYFFKSGVGNEEGEDISSESIKKMMRSIIDKEDTSKPISDQAIADLLAEKGIKISRRTVAKYRDEIGIPSSSRRKRY
ncbi:RNA polymerase factor sigma-54 [Lutispora sp.]|uniref:RNA polymerase factor sigma-54 n=1 Tax=Lutispora sp. TaxID=2828727 RepID=UPI000EC94088|nr:RNA polymerase factor sigma-54 [Lutispora sp.]MEA4960042.1 RNA polymerase factor sigma-54 [Lutispora sp.]HCJ56547.1 RNA polymerase sigma-54 factor [Clostridiaceae bacterium]